MKKDKYLKKNKSKLETIFKSEPEKYEYIIKLINYEADNKKIKECKKLFYFSSFIIL
ncbi:hypothetical protein QMM58_18830 [Clostridioides difficile]|nr:hypothetical protein [Clostridioides difficile]